MEKSLEFLGQTDISKWKKTFKISRACQIARKKSARVFLFYEKLKDRERERERERVRVSEIPEAPTRATE